MTLEEAYKILGMTENDSEEEVKKVYKELAKKYHPDLYQNNPLAYLAEEKLKEVNEAYDILKNFFEKEAKEVKIVNLDGLALAVYKKTDLPFTGEYIFNVSRGEYKGNFQKGLQEGIWTFYLLDGQKEYDYTFSEGVVNGESRGYCQNQIQSIENYKNGLKHGKTYSYITKYEQKEGKLFKIVLNKYSIEGQYYNGKKVGTWKYYNDQTGKLSEIVEYPICSDENIQEIIYETIYNNGKKEGTIKFFYKNGSVEEAFCKQGVLNGKATITYSDLNKEEYEYLNGIIKGEGKGFYWNGEERCKYKNSKKEGPATFYFDNGDKEEFIYINGKMQGAATIYSKNGKKIEFSYVDNIKNGPYTFYASNGNIEKGNYINGKLEGPTVYYYDNGDKEEYIYKDGKKQGKATYYFVNGSYEEFSYVDGVKNGTTIYYFKNGNKEETEYKNGVYEGKATYINVEKGYKEEYIYKNGVITGPAIRLYNVGNKEEFEYKDGKKQGKVIFYDKDNNKKEDTFIDGYLKSELLEVFDLHLEKIISQYNEETKGGLFKGITCDIEMDMENIQLINKMYMSYKIFKENKIEMESIKVKLKKLEILIRKKKENYEKILDQKTNNVNNAKEDIKLYSNPLVHAGIGGFLGYIFSGILLGVGGVIIGLIASPILSNFMTKDEKKQIEILNSEKIEFEKIIREYKKIINLGIRLNLE